MARLLVSVRSLPELQTAVEAGVDVLDLKDPDRGSLGRPATTFVRQTLDRVCERVPVSVALGELIDCDPATLAELPGSLTYAKLGLAGCRDLCDWPDRWAAAWRQLAPPIQRVAVAYADDAASRAPCWRDVLQHGIRLGCRVLLVDTYDKRQGNLTDRMTRCELRELIAEVQSAGLQVALAGSLTLQNLSQMLPWNPDLFAVRGAACRGGRRGTIDRQALGELIACVRTEYAARAAD